jgi:hypothetical protein
VVPRVVGSNPIVRPIEIMILKANNYDNEVVERSFSGDYLVHGDIGKADCVIAASFAYIVDENGDIKPGQSNEDMADFILKNFSNLPKILQFEIAEAYIEMGGAETNLYRIVPDDEKQRLDTPYLIERAKEIMYKNGWETAILIAHPNHMPYVDYLCQTAGIETITPKGLDFIRFEPRSPQYWTVDLKAWRDELIARHKSGDPRKITKD